MRQHKTMTTQDEEIIRKYSLLLDKDFSMDNIRLYREIDLWYGTPYKYGQATRTGTDCSGFVASVFEKVYDIKLPHSSEKQYSTAKKVSRKNIQPADLVFFKLDDTDKISHVGIYLGNGLFIHASTKKGVRYDSMLDEYYSKGFAGAGRITSVQ
jgi:cell wall-associated NlpC family hydrolase